MSYLCYVNTEILTDQGAPRLRAGERNASDQIIASLFPCLKPGF